MGQVGILQCSMPHSARHILALLFVALFDTRFPAGPFERMLAPLLG